jgi:hemolysin activation/secretion protein
MKSQSYLAAMLAVLTFWRGQAAPSPTNAPPGAASATFAVQGYEVEGNTVLPQKLIDSVLTNYIGESIDVARLRQGLGALQLLYRNLGYASISVTLPQQHLTNGIVRVKVIEGRLGRIVVIGNRYFTSNNVLRALPGLQTNVLLNTRWFQPELNQANNNPDRQIYPIIAPGAEPGETDLDLRVKDRLPLHGHIELNDKATPNTPLLRLDSALQYNNLWQLDHQLGLEYDFSPTAFKSSSYMPRFFDQPAVDSYSAFYRLPLGQAAALRDTYDRLPVDFGYDQVTHQFHLPPPLGVPALTVYASRSTIEIPTRYGPLSVLTNEALLNVSQQSAERDLTFTDDLGAKASVPLRSLAGIDSSVSFGVDYKAYVGQTFDTNLTYFSIYGSNSFGNRVLETNKTVPLGTNNGVGVQYLPLSLAWSGARPDAGGSTSFNLEENTFLSPLESRRAVFQEIAGNKAAGGTYAKIDAGVVREERLPKNWSLLLRADGQWASEPLISNEQLPLGGSGGVRGYREGEAYGDTGWRGMFDVRAPPLRIGGFPYRLETIPAYARLSWFMDSGQALRLQAPGAPSVTEWGTGFGVFVTAGEHFDARLTLAWALHDTPLTKAGDAYFYFRVGLQF